MSDWAIGDQLHVRAGNGRIVTCRALSGVMMGEDFPVVWACTEEAWGRAKAEGGAPEGVPWPAEDVQAAGEALR